MKTFEEQYLEVLYDVSTYGHPLNDRTGVGCLYKFGHQFNFHFGPRINKEDSKYLIYKSFPVITTRKMSDFWLYEFNAFCIEYSNNIKSLGKYANIWKPWADESGELGPLYGEQMGKQLPTLMYELLSYLNEEEGSEKYARRFVMTTWNIEQLNDMKLHPCHGTVIQFNIRDRYSLNDHKEYVLDMYTHQRSADLVLGVPHNVCYYSLLVLYLCDYLNRYTNKASINPGIISYSLGNYHIYKNQIEGVKEQIKRKPFNAPALLYNSSSILESELIDYNYHPSIKFPEAAV